MSVMTAIHLLKNDPALPSIEPIEPRSNIYRSGFWSVPIETAKSLKGGRIYFHERQSDPSFFGGIIRDAAIVEEGEYMGVVFTFRFDPSCKGVKTSVDGWFREKKIILDGAP